MWITGFDLPTCSTMYLDKPMRNRSPVRTIARANRKAQRKSAGLIVDHVGVFRHLQKALAIYAAPQGGGVDRPTADKRALVAELEARLGEARAWLEARGSTSGPCWRPRASPGRRAIDAAVEAVLGTPQGCQEYLRTASAVARAYKAILPDPAANAVAPGAILVAFLGRTVRALVDPPDVPAIEGEVERLLDDSVAAQGFRIPDGAEPKPLVSLSEIDLLAALAGQQE
jgi:type I restriction enzyme R subunit